jgi:hypothetical protein
VIALSVVTACASDDSTTGASPVATDQRFAAPLTAAPGSGVLAVQLEDIGHRFFIEGFEVEFVVRSTGGEVLHEIHWTDFVASKTAADRVTPIAAYYDSVWTRTLPPGRVTVASVMHIGMEDRQPLCTTKVLIKAGHRTTVRSCSTRPELNAAVTSSAEHRRFRSTSPTAPDRAVRAALTRRQYPERPATLHLGLAGQRGTAAFARPLGARADSFPMGLDWFAAVRAERLRIPQAH